MEKTCKSPYPPEFEEWWSVYPRKEDKKDAFKQWKKVIKAGEATNDELKEGARQYAAMGHDRRFTKLPATWLNKGSWSNEYAPIGGFGLDKPRGCWIKLDSPEWRAWTQYNNGKEFPHDKRGGWVAPSQWPPAHSEVQQ